MVGSSGEEECDDKKKSVEDVEECAPHKPFLTRHVRETPFCFFFFSSQNFLLYYCAPKFGDCAFTILCFFLQAK